MNVTERIAEAVSQGMFPGMESLLSAPSSVRTSYMEVAETVIEAIRAMPPEEQAELLSGESEAGYRDREDGITFSAAALSVPLTAPIWQPVSRVVGPWRGVTE